MKQLERALEISSSKIEPTYHDDMMLTADVTGATGEHEVACIDGLWRCTCGDYTYRGVGHEEGSYLCKHIIAVIWDMFNHPEKYHDPSHIVLEENEEVLSGGSDA